MLAWKEYSRYGIWVGTTRPDTPAKRLLAPCIPGFVLQAGRAGWLSFRLVGVKGRTIPAQLFAKQKPDAGTALLCALNPLTPSATGHSADMPNQAGAWFGGTRTRGVRDFERGTAMSIEIFRYSNISTEITLKEAQK